MTEPDMSALRARAARGDSDATDELTELATERGDLNELRHLANAGSSTATEELEKAAAEEKGLPRRDKSGQ